MNKMFLFTIKTMSVCLLIYFLVGITTGIYKNKKDIKDVAYLSTSMKDIVDLSFKIVFMKYMKLTHMPLMLDEFGVFMDDTHRNKVYDVIENLLSNNFSQIYFTANFKSIYGRFVDSDINILDDKNLELDDIFYNENLKIVKK